MVVLPHGSHILHLAHTSRWCDTSQGFCWILETTWLMCSSASVGALLHSPVYSGASTDFSRPRANDRFRRLGPYCFRRFRLRSCCLSLIGYKEPTILERRKGATSSVSTTQSSPSLVHLFTAFTNECLRPNIRDSITCRVVLIAIVTWHFIA